MGKTDFTEIEGKILDIDIEFARKKLTSLGAKKINDLYFKRYVFDVIPADTNTWIRLRTDGQKSTLTVKKISNDSVTGTQEWEVEVSDFDITLLALEKMGINPRGYQENKRESYKLGDVEISIDEWPMIPAYLEIEGSSESVVKETVSKLGYDVKDLNGKNTDKIYDHYGIDIKSMPTLKF